MCTVWNGWQQVASCWRNNEPSASVYNQTTEAMEQLKNDLHLTRLHDLSCRPFTPTVLSDELKYSSSPYCVSNVVYWTAFKWMCTVYHMKVDNVTIFFSINSIVTCHPLDLLIPFTLYKTECPDKGFDKDCLSSLTVSKVYPLLCYFNWWYLSLALFI